MSKMIGFPAKTEFVAAGACVASKTRKLADGRFEGAAALFASDPAQGHKSGIRCNQVFANAAQRYKLDEAQALPELSGVLARLQDRESMYVAFLAKKEAETARREKRRRLLRAESHRQGVRILPAQVMRLIYAQTGA